MASLTPGTCKQWLWLLPSGPDQVHHPAMRGDPPRRILPQATLIPNVNGAKNIGVTGFRGRTHKAKHPATVSSGVFVWGAWR